MYIILKYMFYIIYIMYINPNVNWALVNVSRLVHKLEKKITAPVSHVRKRNGGNGKELWELCTICFVFL